MEKKDFKFKKEFGQNFIFDKNFLESVVRDISLEKSSQILEIGAGMGTLSECLANNFKRVVSYEIDKTLTEHLNNLATKHDNLSFVFKDIMEEKIENIDKLFDNRQYFMIANLPYYITSPIIFKFLFDSQYIAKMFVMVQKEVGERFCAKPHSKDYGASTVLINTFGQCRIIKNVSRKMFTPMPKVDSCIIEIDINKKKYNIDNLQEYKDFINSCFKMKRKTLYNNLSQNFYDKDKIKEIIHNLSLNVSVRPEELSTDDFYKLYISLKNILN